jgi:predicted acylesterase/phospholipase RssA
MNKATAGGGQRKKRSVVGLALAGGGPLGGIYEVGALCALSEALPQLDFTALDVYVGVSSGALVAASLVNGMAPRQLAAILIGEDESVTGSFPDIFFHPAWSEYFRRGCQLPRLITSAVLDLLWSPLRQGWIGPFARLGEALPAGTFDNAPIEQYLATLFAGDGRSNDFRKLAHPLFVVAVDLDSGESVRFGAPGHDHVPISKAVQASTALPGLYTPVAIDGRHYVDGVLKKTLHASVALEWGADLLFCINPLVPYDASVVEQAERGQARSLAAQGLPVVMSQALRSIINSRMRISMATYAKQFPGQDLLLFEPETDDTRMFFTNVFSFAERHSVCEHAYQKTRADLLRRREALEPVLNRHGLRADWAGLEQPRQLGLGRRRRGSRRAPAAVALNRELDRLEAWLKLQRHS